MTLFVLAPIAVISLASCKQVVGEDSTLARSANTVLLADRAFFNMTFVHPDIQVIRTRYRQPLMDYLTANTLYVGRALFNTGSERTLSMLETRMTDVADLEVVSYFDAHRKFGAVPLVRPLNRDGEPVSHSVFVTRQDSPLENLSDLEGRSLALGDFHSTLSNLVARHELIRAGVELDAIGSIEHFDNDEAVATAVLEGRFDAGAVADLVAYQHQDEGLRALHVSDPVPSAPWVVRHDLPARVVDTIREALLEIDFEEADDRADWEEGIRYGFAPATDADYDLIREIMKTSPTGCEGSCHGPIGARR